MFFISHRGNLEGRDPKRENSPDYIDEAIQQGYHVEIDVWLNSDGTLWLGHDEPQYHVSESWLINRWNQLWCHAKEISAFEWLIENRFECFMHDQDVATLTFNRWIWTYPGEKLTNRSICVLPEVDLLQKGVEYWKDSAGVCSDWVVEQKKEWEKNAKV